MRTKVLAPQTSGRLATVFVDGVSCRPCVVPPGRFGTIENKHLSNTYVKRDFIFSKLEFTGKYRKVPEATFKF